MAILNMTVTEVMATGLQIVARFLAPQRHRIHQHLRLPAPPYPPGFQSATPSFRQYTWIATPRFHAWETPEPDVILGGELPLHWGGVAGVLKR